MDTERLHPMDAPNLKIFSARVAQATNEEIVAAWQKWQGEYSKNQAYQMKARLARMAPSKDLSTDDDLEILR
jgi:hypothetical protein